MYLSIAIGQAVAGTVRSLACRLNWNDTELGSHDVFPLPQRLMSNVANERPLVLQVLQQQKQGIGQSANSTRASPVGRLSRTRASMISCWRSTAALASANRRSASARLFGFTLSLPRGRSLTRVLRLWCDRT